MSVAVREACIVNVCIISVKILLSLSLSSVYLIRLRNPLLDDLLDGNSCKKLLQSHLFPLFRFSVIVFIVIFMAHGVTGDFRPPTLPFELSRVIEECNITYYAMHRIFNTYV